MRHIISAVLILFALSVAAAPIDDARRLYEQGEYEQALDRLQKLRKRTPRSGEINYYLGATLVALNRVDEAVEYLEVAQNRDYLEAPLMLARLASEDYRPDDALEYLNKYEAIFRKKKRNTELPDNIAPWRSRMVLMQNMLSRVERIEVIDSVIVDAENFFENYRLTSSAGKLVRGTTVMMPDIEVAYIPQNHTEMLYADADSLGVFSLMHANILDDGSIEQPGLLKGDNLGGGGNAEYPYMLSDGVTLYFANDGENSLGGYDIFLTHRTEDGCLQPQNIGMPFNSPDDDYFLVIDESQGIGWWATDRNHIPGKVTIYTFIPSQSRVNVEVEDTNLVALARLSDISLTQNPSVDYSEIRQRINQVSSDDGRQSVTTEASFVLPIGSATTIYYQLSDFKSSQARSAMMQAIDARAQIVGLTRQLEQLRSRYSEGDYSVDTQILNLEQQLSESRNIYKNSINQAISLELNHN